MSNHALEKIITYIRGKKVMKKIILVMIKAYQAFISPLYAPACRFTPTCSTYAREAFSKYGVAKALFLSAKRILKCHPFNPGGYDPVQ